MSARQLRCGDLVKSGQLLGRVLLSRANDALLWLRLDDGRVAVVRKDSARPYRHTSKKSST